MRQPLRRQIYLPFGILAVASTVGIAAVTATVSVRTRQSSVIRRLDRVVETLRTSQFPFTPAVIEQMHGLSDAQFIVRDSEGAVTATTLQSVPTTLGPGRLSKNEVVDR